MKIIVVIGGIGSGKSTVSAAFRDLGAAFIDLDQVGHDNLLRDDVKRDLAEAFGADILGEDGQVIRPKLAKRAFASPDKTALLNEISHPRLIDEARRRLAAFEVEGAQATVIEISPYDGPQGSFGVFTDMADAVVAVVAPEELRIERAVARGFSEQDVRNRMARQATDDERRPWATHVIVNNASIDALRQVVATVWDKVVVNPTTPDGKPQGYEVSDGLQALEAAYNAPEVSFPMMAMGAAIVIGLVLILVILWVMA